MITHFAYCTTTVANTHVQCDWNRSLRIRDARGLRGSAGGAGSYPLVARPQFAFRDLKRCRELPCHVVRQRNLASFDTSNDLGGDAGSGAELWLGQPSQNPPIAGVTVTLRNLDEVGNGHPNRGGDTGEQINLRRRVAKFPSSNRVGIESRQAREFALRYTSRSAGFLQLIRLESAHNSTAHRLSLTRKVVITRHCAIPSLRCAHNGTYESVGIDSDRQRWEFSPNANGPPAVSAARGPSEQQVDC